MASDDVPDDSGQEQSLNSKNLTTNLTEKAPTVKEPHAFRTISEVSEELHVPQHVLRFWESRFKEITPLKRNGGRRYYRSEDVALLRRISTLLYVQGYTVKGVQRMLENNELDAISCQENPLPEKKLSATNEKTTPDPTSGIQLDALEKRNVELSQILQTILEELYALRKTLSNIN